MQWVEDEVLLLVGAVVAGDHLGTTADDHLVDIAAHQHLGVPEPRWDGVVGPPVACESSCSLRVVFAAQKLGAAGTHKLKPHALGNKKIFPDRKLSAVYFSEFLNELGVPCAKTDIENDRRKAPKVGWVPHLVPSNTRTKDILRKLKREVFPNLQIDQFLTKDAAFTLVAD
jgi:hypothetical protein